MGLAHSAWWPEYHSKAGTLRHPDVSCSQMVDCPPWELQGQLAIHLLLPQKMLRRKLALGLPREQVCSSKLALHRDQNSPKDDAPWRPGRDE